MPDPPKQNVPAGTVAFALRPTTTIWRLRQRPAPFDTGPEWVRVRQAAIEELPPADYHAVEFVAGDDAQWVYAESID